MPEIELTFQANIKSILAILPLLVILLGWLLYRRTYPPVSESYRYLLLTLRLLALALVGLLLFDPVLRLTRPLEKQMRTALLIDNSASMLLPETAAGAGSRLERAAQIRNNLLAGGTDFELFTFGDRLQALGQTDSLTAGNVSPISDLSGAVEQLIEQSTAGFDRLIVVSDGNINAGRNPADSAFAGKLPPVWNVLVGEKPAQPDLAVESVESLDNRIYSGRTFSLQVQYSVRGIEKDMPLDIEVTGQDGVTAHKVVNVPSSGAGMFSETLELGAGEPGEKLFAVRVSSALDEWTTLNNIRYFHANVLKGRNKILILSNKPNWDFTFLGRALAEDEDNEVESILILGGGKEIRSFRADDGESGAELPGARKLEQHDLLALHGNLSQMPSSLINAVISRADRGGLGLIVWPDTELSSGIIHGRFSAYLPFDNNKISTISKIGLEPTNSRIMGYDRYGILSSMPSSVSGAEEIPPLESVYQQAPFRSGWDVIASAGVARTKETAFPVIAAAEIGRTKTVDVLGSGLWRWHMMDRSGTDKSNSLFNNLWQGISKWLLSVEKISEFSFRPEKNIYETGEKVTFMGRKTDSAGIDSILVDIVSATDTIYSAPVFAADSGNLRLELGKLSPGEYSYRAYHEGGTSGAQAVGAFAVENYSSDMQRIEPDSTLLNALSRLSGGENIPVAEYAGGGTIPLDEKVKVERTDRIKLAHRAWLYYLIVLCLVAEWYLRRRKSLV